MDQLIAKGTTRNRYAKFQPLVNRINGLQIPNPASNSLSYHRARRADHRGIASYSCQLENDSGNLALATSRTVKVLKKQTDGQLRSLKIPATLFNHSVYSPVTNTETARKQKKHRHRNEAKIYRTLPIDLKAELLDILNCILYLISSPFILFARLFFTLASFSVTMLIYNVSKFSSLRGEKLKREEGDSKYPEKKLLMINSPENNREERAVPNLNEFLTKRRSDFNSVSRLVSQGIANSTEIDKAEVKNIKNQKLRSLKKNFKLSLETMNKMRASSALDGAKYFQYSLRHQDISSVELSSDCLSDKYSRRLLNNKDCWRKIMRQYPNSVSNAGKKMPFSTLKNSSFERGKTVVNSKRQIDVRNSSRKSEFRLDRIDQKNRLYATDLELLNSKQRTADCDFSIAETERAFNRRRKSSVSLLNNCRKKRSEKSRPYACSCLPLRPVLQRECVFKDEEKCDDRPEKFICISCSDFKNNSVVPESLNRDLRPIVELTNRVTREVDGDLSQKKKLYHTAAVPICLNQYNAEKLISEHDTKSCISQGELKSDTLENGTLIPEHLEDVLEFNGVVQKDKSEKEVETSESASLRLAERGLSESKEISRYFETEKKAIGSGDRLRVIKNETSRIAEFTRPIDAKSKWLEIKKKFYGKEYAVVNEKPKELEAENLKQISSMSKLPAHKIFQYNMQVARARQMGAEPPSTEDAFLEKRTISSGFKALENRSLGLNLSRKNEPQFLQSVIRSSRCLSQTQSLSQWPIDSGNSSKTKKYCSLEQKPKPKPRTERGFNHAKPPALNQSTAHFPQRSSARTNSSVSSSDVRTPSQNYTANYTNRNGLESTCLLHRTGEHLIQTSNGETEDPSPVRTTMNKQTKIIPENSIVTNLQRSNNEENQNLPSFSHGFYPLPRGDQPLHNGSRSPDSPLHVKNPTGIILTNNQNSVNEYSKKIDSLISF